MTDFLMTLLKYEGQIWYILARDFSFSGLNIMRIILYGKGDSINGLYELCSLQGYHVKTMDDDIFDTQQLDQADIIVVSPYLGRDHKIFARYRDKINTELQFL
jgi:hypothetical protein